MKIEQSNSEKSVAGIIPKLPGPMAYEYITPERAAALLAIPGGRRPRSRKRVQAYVDCMKAGTGSTPMERRYACGLMAAFAMAFCGSWPAWSLA